MHCRVQTLLEIKHYTRERKADLVEVKKRENYLENGPYVALNMKKEKKIKYFALHLRGS